ncbi:MAG: hypothetical protein ACRDHG_06210 [Anaerolineales bacterium]
MDSWADLHGEPRMTTSQFQAEEVAERERRLVRDTQLFSLRLSGPEFGWLFLVLDHAVQALPLGRVAAEAMVAEWLEQVSEQGYEREG